MTGASVHRRINVYLSRTQNLIRGHALTLTTLVDQGVLSLVNFLTAAIIGRLSGPENLGLYTLFFTALTLLIAVAESLFLAPYTMAFRRHSIERQAHYSANIIVFQLLFALAGAGLLLAFGAYIWSTGGQSHAGILIAACCALPPVLIRESLRRISLAHLAPRPALEADALLGALQISGILALIFAGKLNAATAVLMIAVANALAVAAWWLRASIPLKFANRSRLDDLGTSMTYGIGNIAALGSFIAQIYMAPWVLAIIADKAAVGQLAACHTLAMITNPLVQGIANTLMPRAAAIRQNGASAELVTLLWRSAIGLALAMGFFAGIFLFAGQFLLTQIFGSNFGQLGAIVALLALAAAVRAVGMAPYIGLWVVGRSFSNFLVNGLSIAITLPLILFTFPDQGLHGVAIAVLIGDIVGMCARWMLFLIPLRGSAGKGLAQ